MLNSTLHYFNTPSNIILNISLGAGTTDDLMQWMLGLVTAYTPCIARASTTFLLLLSHTPKLMQGILLTCTYYINMN